MAQEKAYKVREIAAALRVNPTTIKREISRGRLRHYRVGRVIRVPESALQQYTGRAAAGE